MRIIKKSLVLEDGCYVNTKLRLQRIPSKGRGVVAVRKIRKGEIIALSGGVVFPAVGLWHLPIDRRKYCYHLENNFFMCPLHFSRKSRIYYMNHSCSSNVGGGRR